MDNLPPVTSLSLIDLLPRLLQLREDPIAFLNHVLAEHGERVRYRVGKFSLVILNNPADIQHVLISHNKYYDKDTFQYRQLSQIVGMGLLTNSSETWRENRRAIQPAFNHTELMDHIPTILETTAEFIEKWAAFSQEGFFDLDKEMMELSLQILGKTVFGVDLKQHAPKVVRAVKTVLDYLVFAMKHPQLWPGAPFDMRARKFQDAKRDLDESIQEIIEEYRSGSRVTAARKTIMDILFNHENSHKFTDQGIRDELLTFIVAGHETVASALTWTCYLLTANSQWEQELHRTLQTAGLGFDEGQASNLISAVFSEALRLYPPAWLVTRRCIQEDRLEGMTIQTGALVVIPITTVQRNSAYWPAPGAFNPRRFLQKEELSRPRLAFMPFGAGPRLCIGNHFANLEASLVLESIYKRYHFIPADQRPVEADALVTQRPSGGLWVRLAEF